MYRHITKPSQGQTRTQICPPFLCSAACARAANDPFGMLPLSPAAASRQALAIKRRTTPFVTVRWKSGRLLLGGAGMAAVGMAGAGCNVNLGAGAGAACAGCYVKMCVYEWVWVKVQTRWMRIR